MRIDDTAPVTTSNTATSTYDTTATITLSASDAFSGVATTELPSRRWRVDQGASITTTVGGPHTLEWMSH